MTEHEALTKIQELIDNYLGTELMYYCNSENTAEASAAKLCYQINIECVIPADEVVKPFDVPPIKAGFCFCGVRVNENQSFCPHCGIRLDWGE